MENRPWRGKRCTDFRCEFAASAQEFELLYLNKKVPSIWDWKLVFKIDWSFNYSPQLIFLDSPYLVSALNCPCSAYCTLTQVNYAATALLGHNTLCFRTRRWFILPRCAQFSSISPVTSLAIPTKSGYKQLKNCSCCDTKHHVLFQTIKLIDFKRVYSNSLFWWTLSKI